MARPRQFDQEEVVDRAMEVFWRLGYEGASMAELTRAMRINSPSLYAAFGSKRALFDTVLERYRMRRAAFWNGIQTAPTARAAISTLLRGAVEWLTDPTEPPGCLMVQAALTAGPANTEIPALLASRRLGVETLLRERLERARAEGDLPPDTDPSGLARACNVVFIGLCVQAAAGASTADLLDTAERALQMVPRPER